MGPGTALLLAAVGPRPGTGYVLHKYLLDEVRDKRGPGHAGGREPRTVWVFLLAPKTSPFPASPRQPLYLRGCRAHSAASPPPPHFLRNPESPEGPRELLCGLQTYNLVFKPTSREVCGGQREPASCCPTLSECGYTLTHIHTHTHTQIRTVIQAHTLNSLVRPNLHTIKFTRLKGRIQWFLSTLNSCAFIIII